MKKSRIIKIPLIFLFVMAGTALIYFSGICKAGIKSGLTICADTIIPSLFPFICFSNIALGIFSPSAENKLLGKIYFSLFSLPLSTAKVFLFSLIGGYPIGPMMSARMVEENKITAPQGKRLTLFCCNAGPAFSITAVGCSFCNSRKLGVFLCLSNIFSALVIGIISGRFKVEGEQCKVNILDSKKPDFSAVLTDSVEKSAYAMLKICAWIILFNMINSLIDMIDFTPEIKMIISGLLEVTTGCSDNRANPIMLSAILGFGGISVLFQVKEYINKVGLTDLQFILTRLCNACLSAAFTALLLHFSPVSIAALAAGTAVKLTSQSIPLSALLIFSLAVFILDKKIISKPI